MSLNPGGASPRSLSEVSHLFFSTVDAPKTFRSPSPSLDAERVKTAVRANCARLFNGSRLVDDGVREPRGVDLLLADPEGRPVFVEIFPEDPEMIPFKILARWNWLKGCRPLFGRAFLADGIRNVDEPLFCFISPSFPDEVVRAVRAMDRCLTKLCAVLPLRVHGRQGIWIIEVHPDPTTPGVAVLPDASP